MQQTIRQECTDHFWEAIQAVFGPRYLPSRIIGPNQFGHSARFTLAIAYLFVGFIGVL